MTTNKQETDPSNNFEGETETFLTFKEKLFKEVTVLSESKYKNENVFIFIKDSKNIFHVPHYETYHSFHSKYKAVNTLTECVEGKNLVLSKENLSALFFKNNFDSFCEACVFSDIFPGDTLLNRHGSDYEKYFQETFALKEISEMTIPFETKELFEFYSNFSARLERNILAKTVESLKEFRHTVTKSSWELERSIETKLMGSEHVDAFQTLMEETFLALELGDKKVNSSILNKEFYLVKFDESFLEFGEPYIPDNPESLYHFRKVLVETFSREQKPVRLLPAVFVHAFKGKDITFPGIYSPSRSFSEDQMQTLMVLAQDGSLSWGEMLNVTENI